uniref:little elongation complex subunit 1 isoform X2 n=1 Tax=Jaculus jaculus TaxID=51337 RepID=UPI001E1B0CC0|nr:little elongation complex subunit 1 isoform X2 [Jaculus jaculus]
MMPGETQPAAPGSAAGLARCQGCASLQQNLNEYVEALITLKQKIINTDNLLTEYQKKCDELQFARRENSTLHHQVEQMLQKISPLQKCQEELGSLKAELEEKKSSLKLYQDTQQEYARVKEECLKSDAQKKKLEAKVKKLEEAVMRQTQDFKQLRNEKKMLEKEFKKTQERLDEFSKQKNERELRHIGTQISSDSYRSIDKRKVKGLLKELWLCVNGVRSVHGPENPTKENAIHGPSGEGGALPLAQGSPPRTSGVQARPTELSVEGEGHCANCERAEDEQSSEGGKRNPQSISHEERHATVMEAQPGAGDRADFPGCGRSLDEDLQAAIHFFKPPPPLLSPVPSPPLPPPRLSAFSAPLLPETYFGAYTDSSDNDSVPLGSTAESASEDEAVESQDYFGLLGKSEGDRTWAGKPKPQSAVRILRRSSARTVTPNRTEPLVALPKEPLTPLSSAQGRHWIASPRFVNEQETFNVAERQVGIEKPGSSVQAGNTLHKPAWNRWVEMPSVSLTQEKVIGAEESEPSSSPLVERTLSELSGAEGKSPSSTMKRLPQPGFTKCSLTDGIPSESDLATGAGCFQRSGERAKEREAVRGSMLGSPEPDSPSSDDGMEVVGLDGEGSFSSSSTSASVCSKPQSSRLTLVSNAHNPVEVFPRQVCHAEQLQMGTLDAFLLRAEPPSCAEQEHNPGQSTHALSSVLGAPAFNDQQSRKKEGTNILKGMTKMYSLPQSVFRKATKDGQCESQGPVPRFTLRPSGLTTVACSQPGSGTRGSAVVRSASWHHSDVLRRAGRESPVASSECEQKGSRQSEKGVPALGGGGLTSEPEQPKGRAHGPPASRASAALLPNQVSVITKQTRPEKAPSAILEQRRPRGDEQTSATESHTNTAGALPSVAGRARAIQEAAVVKSPSPEVSASWGKPDAGFPRGSLPAESFDYSTDGRVTFSAEHSLTQSQDSESESAPRGEPWKCTQPPPAVRLGATRVHSEELRAAEVTESCRAAGRAGTEAPVVTGGAPSAPQRAAETFPESRPARSSPLGSADEEAQDGLQSRLPVASRCSTGLRDPAGEDTELEESEACSCSEGERELEAEGTAGGGRQQAVGDSGRHVGDSKAEAAEARPCTDVGFLTSALQDFSLSPFPDLDRLSTSEVVMFLQSCQLRDYSSGDSVSECSSRGTLTKEWKQSAVLLGNLGKCEEEMLGTSEEWVEAEDDDPSENFSQHGPCSLETLSAVLTKLGRELHAHREDCSSEDADRPVLLSVHSSPTADHLEAVPLEETPAPHAPELPRPAVGNSTGSSPRGTCDPEHIQSRLKEDSNITKSANSVEGDLKEPGPPLTLSSYCEAPLRPEQSRSCVAESAVRYRISTVTSEVINVVINKNQNVVIEKGDNWTIISGVAISPGMGQVLCGTVGDGPISQDQGTLDASSGSVMSKEKPIEAGHTSALLPEPPGGSNFPGSQEDVSSTGQSANFDKSRLRSRPVKPSIWVSSQIYDQLGETERVVAFDHTYCNWKLESVSKSKNRSKISNKDQSPKPGKTWGLSRDDACQGEVNQPSGARESTKPLRTQAQPILANADTSTPMDSSPDTLSKIRQEVGPPLPPLLAPLIATPPRSSQPVSPVISSSSPSPASPASHVSPLCDISGPPGLSSWPETAQQASSPGPSPAPSPAAGAAGRIVSSPLQFCSATPKHALPVPGRLPPCAPGHAVVGGTQENSVKILDTMYPELSARARTLNLLKGNLQLSRGSCVDGKVLIGFKAITSTSTAFVKTRSSCGGEGSQKSRDMGTQQGMSAKRTSSACTLRSAKRLRLDSESPEPESRAVSAGVKNLPGTAPQADPVTAEEGQSASPGGGPASPLPGDPKETVESPDEAIARAMKKVAEAAFDLLPVIRSHVYVGNISKKPVMRDQEKEVVYEFSTTKKALS